jgi:hypothetical protein
VRVGEEVQEVPWGVGAIPTGVSLNFFDHVRG